MGNLGPWEIAIIVLVVLLLFGAKAVPRIGRSAGKSIRELKDSVGEVPRELKEAMDTPAELREALNPKQALKDAINPFRPEDEEQLVEALDDADVKAALAPRATVAAPSVPLAADPTEPAPERVVEAEPARPVDQ